MSCVVIAKGQAYRSKQNLQTFEGVSAESAGSKALCLHVITIPPGGRAKPHLHENHESCHAPKYSGSWSRAGASCIEVTVGFQ